MKTNNLIFLIISFIVIYSCKRSHKEIYCLGEKGICITVLKNEDKCIIVPKRYNDSSIPQSNYVVSSCNQSFTFYFDTINTDVVIVRDEGSFYEKDDYQIFSADSTILDYEKNKDIVYNVDSKKFKDVNENICLLTINLKERYASSLNESRIEPVFD